MSVGKGVGKMGRDKDYIAISATDVFDYASLPEMQRKLVELMVELVSC